MAVTVSLLDLVAVRDTRRLWPEKFLALVGKLEDDPTEHDQLLVIADWLQEQDERLLEAAFRYVGKRHELDLKVTRHGTFSYWNIENLTYAVSQQKVADVDDSTAAGAFARLALQLDAARKDLE